MVLAWSGGVFGAWLGSCIAGGLVAGLGHGTIGLISWCSGSAAVPVGAALEFWFGATITSAAYAAAVAGGMFGAVVTGPV